MELRIKEVAKHKGYKMKELSEKLNVSQMALSFWQTGKREAGYKTLKSIADVLNCEVIELLPVGDGYSHFYDDKTGEWLGVRKK
ncbi:helix-turn-helix transcriptional regulator [Sphingobacterium sp. ML3W]|uniref:helix-turn-helix domain-containing protein n=1 Tax=Sphingobacterium sp. ML3W TaxID=1538644 RepID=UPI00249C1EC5|nr:helix-turn-helix transcriptional regulator [Sphingobacterium sp. ML3W]WFA79642.1 helix-turn-helix transcriptional regulator [Sphingobacterium sp. ML3W]